MNESYVINPGPGKEKTYCFPNSNTRVTNQFINLKLMKFNLLVPHVITMGAAAGNRVINTSNSFEEIENVPNKRGSTGHII